MSDIDDCRKSVERLTRDRGEVMRAGNDKIAEIRKRHEQSEKNYIELESTWKAQIHDDRAFLLAEVERLRAEIERLKRDSDEAREESKPVQEPVAWRNKKWGYFTVNPIASKHTDWEPLYTAQRPRQLRNALEGKP